MTIFIFGSFLFFFCMINVVVGKRKDNNSFLSTTFFSRKVRPIFIKKTSITYKCEFNISFLWHLFLQIAIFVYIKSDDLFCFFYDKNLEKSESVYRFTVLVALSGTNQIANLVILPFSIILFKRINVLWVKHKQMRTI
jgi:hypothetical protein